MDEDAMEAERRKFARCIGAHDLRSAVATGVKEGIKEAARDKEFVDQFWKEGFSQLREHTTSGASQWVGKRILTTLILSVVFAGIVWLVRTGVVK